MKKVNDQSSFFELPGWLFRHEVLIIHRQKFILFFLACSDATIGAFYSSNGFETEYIYYGESSIFDDKDKVYNNL